QSGNRHRFYLVGSLLREGACFTGIQKLLSVNAAEKLDQFCDQAGPSGLVAGAQARAVVAMEVLIEQDVILPLGIGLELLRASVHRPTPRFVTQEDPVETVGNLPGHLEQA